VFIHFKIIKISKLEDGENKKSVKDNNKIGSNVFFHPQKVEYFKKNTYLCPRKFPYEICTSNLKFF